MLITGSMAADKKYKRILAVLFIGYMILLFYFLFFSEGFGRLEEGREYHYNLVPFREIIRFMKYRRILGFQSFFVNIYGNVIAFMPLGFFIPGLLQRRVNGFFVVLCCFTLSLAVEIIQLVTRLGCCDVDDLILNTLGGLFGYLIYLVIHRFHRGKRD